MQEVARFAFAVTHGIVIAAFIVSGVWRRLPVCFAMLCCASILAVTYAPESREWIRDYYLQIEPLVVFLRFAAAIEAAWLLSPARVRLPLISGLFLTGIAVAAAIAKLNGGSSLQTFVQIRSYAQIGTAVFLVALLCFLWSQRLWTWSTLAAHAVILTVLMVKQAVYSALWLRGGLWPTLSRWQAADWPGLAVSSLCCLAWGIFALRLGKRAQ